MSRRSRAFAAAAAAIVGLTVLNVLLIVQEAQNPFWILVQVAATLLALTLIFRCVRVDAQERGR